MRMDVLLQNSKTGLYLKRDLSWTARREEGFVFVSSGEAIDFAYEHRIGPVQLILFFPTLQHSLVVPFQPESVLDVARSTASLSRQRSKPF
jgi:hypothetical protein